MCKFGRGTDPQPDKQQGDEWTALNYVGLLLKEVLRV